MTFTVAAVVDSAIAIRAGWTVVLVLWGTTIVALLLAGWRTLRPCEGARRLHAAAAVAFLGCVMLLVAALLLSVMLASTPPAPVLGTTVVPSGGSPTMVFAAPDPPA